MPKLLATILWSTSIGVIPAQAQPPMTSSAGVASVQYVPVGTKFAVRILADLTTKKKQSYSGQRFPIETVAPVMIGPLVVIPAGTRGEGEIIEARNKGMWGKSGFVEVRAVHLNMSGRRVRLTGGINDKGVTGTAVVVGAVMTSWPLGFIMTGTSARIPRGTAFTAILDEDLPFIMGAPAGDMLAQSSLPTAQPPMSDGGETAFRNGVPQ